MMYSTWRLYATCAFLSACGAFLSITGAAQAETLTFDGNICQPGGNSACVPGIDIGTNYGSVTGQLDVIFTSRAAAGNGEVSNNHLRFWAQEFGDLFNVAYAARSIGGATLVGEVALVPKPGFRVTLNGFDLASWQSPRNSQVTIYDIAYNVLSSSGTVSVPSSGHTHFAPGITRADGIVLQYGPDSFNVGIDNIDFTVAPVTAVPEPGLFTMLAVGIGLVGLRLHAKRKS